MCICSVRYIYTYTYIYIYVYTYRTSSHAGAFWRCTPRVRRRRPGRRRQQQQRSLRSTDEPVHASAVSAGPDELDKSVCKNVRAVIVISYFVNSNTLVNGNLKSS